MDFSVPFFVFSVTLFPVSASDISAALRQFIFEHVDSLALIEILFFLRDRPEGCFKADQVAKELRTSTDSTRNKLEFLIALHLVANPQPEEFCYRPATPELAELVKELADFYKIKPHKVLELIFSPVKRARQFADAFSLVKPPKSEGESDG